jgi:putative addiction module killer protein
LRIHYAKGFRVYLRKFEGTIILLLNGGTKSSQQKDIEKAKELWGSYKDKFENGN